MTERRPPGRSLVNPRAIADIVRPAVAGSYGVTGFVSATLGERLLGFLGLVEPGIRMTLKPALTIDLYLTVAYGLPVAEVARQADSAVRYAVRRSLGCEIERLTIHVGGMRYQAEPPAPAQPAGPVTAAQPAGPPAISNTDGARATTEAAVTPGRNGRGDAGS